MGRMKEQQEQIYLTNGESSIVCVDAGLEQPTFIGLIDIIKNFASANEFEDNSKFEEFDYGLQEFNPKQFCLFNAEAI